MITHHALVQIGRQRRDICMWRRVQPHDRVHSNQHEARIRSGHCRVVIWMHLQTARLVLQMEIAARSEALFGSDAGKREWRKQTSALKMIGKGSKAFLIEMFSDVKTVCSVWSRLDRECVFPK